jgi:hypothetical protein
MQNEAAEEGLDLVGVRALLCALVEQAITDVLLEKGITKLDAEDFLNSEIYEDICCALGLPAAALKDAAYDRKHNNSKERKGQRPTQKREPLEVSGELRPNLQEEGDKE